MEISPRRSLSLDFDASVFSPIASSFPPTYINSKPNIYTMQAMQSVPEPKITKSFGLTSSLSMDSAGQNIFPPKKENFISNMFNAITSVFMEGIAKVPVSFTTNINNTLSVTVVPNEGIISPEFFKNLTQSCEQLVSDNNKETMNIPEILPRSKSFSDVESQSPYIFNDISRIDAMSTKLNKNSRKIDDNIEKNLDSKLIIENSKKSQICHDNDITMKASNTVMPTVNEGVGNIVDWTGKNFNENKMLPNIGEQSTNSWHTIWQREANDMSDRFNSRAMSPESEVPIKKPNLAVYPHTKPRRKLCSLAVRGRGKGRGKSQLRRSGVSQSRHRKERTKQNIYSNIQDDLEVWEESECYDSENDLSPHSTQQNEEKLSPCEKDWKHCSTLLESFNVDELSKPKKCKQRIRERSVNSSLRVVYIRESSIATVSQDSRDVDDCLPKIPGFRPRLISESSVESDDSFCIVFDNNSDSESTNYDYDSDSDEDLDGNLDNENSTTTQTVRFNLEPKVHMMVQWNYAYREARRGPWEEMARDRERFRGRIRCIERILEPILVPQHRKSVWHERFDVE